MFENKIKSNEGKTKVKPIERQKGNRYKNVKCRNVKNVNIMHREIEKQRQYISEQKDTKVKVSKRREGKTK